MSIEHDGVRGEARVFKEGEACQRVHLWLYESDVAWLDANFANAQGNTIRRSKFVRLSVRKIILAVQGQAARQAKSTTELASELDGLGKGQAGLGK